MLQLLLLTLILFTAMAYAQEPSPEMRSSQSAEFRIHGPIDKVFPLFTPKGELLWIPTWKYTPVYPASGDTERDMVFHTDDGSTTWTLALYDSPNTSIYVWMNPNLVARIEVNCRALSPTETSMRITYTWTALNDQGRHHAPSSADFQAKMQNWKIWLNDYAKKAGW